MEYIVNLSGERGPFVEEAFKRLLAKEALALTVYRPAEDVDEFTKRRLQAEGEANQTFDVDFYPYKISNEEKLTILGTAELSIGADREGSSDHREAEDSYFGRIDFGPNVELVVDRPFETS